MELQNLKNSISNAQSAFARFEEEWRSKKQELKMLSSSIEDNKKSLAKLQSDNKIAETSKEVISNIILSTRNEAIEFIENVVNAALLDVFQNPNLKLKLQLNTEGSKTSISTFIEENGELYDIESGRGGGLRDLVSTAILICCRALVNPKIELPLLLDESFKFLHSTKDNAFKTNAFKFLKDVANKLGVQIVLITGEEEKSALDNADNVLYVEKHGTISSLSKL